MTYNYNPKSKSIVTLHYVGTTEEGREFDNSRKRGEPLTFTVGSGQMIPGFEANVVGMKKGENKTFTLNPEEAYGEILQNLFQTYPRDQFPPDFEIVVGKMINVPTNTGQIFPASINFADEEKVVLNFNHPMAGQKLNFDVEVINIINEKGETLGEVNTNEETGQD